MNHAWDETIHGEAVIGVPPHPHHMQIWAGDTLAFSITGQITAFALENGCGRKFVLGVPYLRRARENAEQLQDVLDSRD